MDRYTVHFCAGNGGHYPALIVTDEVGAAYLFARDALQVRCGGPDAPARLRRLLARRAAWRAAAGEAPRSLDELRRLLGAADAA